MIAEKDLREEQLTVSEHKMYEHIMACEECKKYYSVYMALTDIINGKIFEDCMSELEPDMRILRLDTQENIQATFHIRIDRDRNVMFSIGPMNSKLNDTFIEKKDVRTGRIFWALTRTPEKFCAALDPAAGYLEIKIDAEVYAAEQLTAVLENNNGETEKRSFEYHMIGNFYTVSFSNISLGNYCLCLTGKKLYREISDNWIDNSNEKYFK